MDIKKINSVDDYIIKFPKDIQDILQKLRQTIKDSAPHAKEAMSYGAPAFQLNGNLVLYAAFKNHIGLYPTPSAIKKFKKELDGYETSEGTIKFPLDKPLPFDLIKKIVKFRVKENLQKK
ncbi:MAG: iron chaperone [Nanobdellota archaeon]